MDKKYYYWGGGILAFGGVLWLVTRKRAVTTEADAQGASMGNTTQPIFLAGGGGTPLNTNPGGSVANLPLGGGTWQTPLPPLADNPDVAIARINSEVSRANTAAQLELGKIALDLQKPVPVTPSAPPVVKRATMSEAVDFITGFINKPGGITNRDSLVIAEQAREHGFSAKEVASALNIASNTTRYTDSFVNTHLSKLGVAPLPGSSTIQ